MDKTTEAKKATTTTATEKKAAPKRRIKTPTEKAAVKAAPEPKVNVHVQAGITLSTYVNANRRV
jgi:hypothetical protein